jgi:hypothetical protein
MALITNREILEFEQILSQYVNRRLRQVLCSLVAGETKEIYQNREKLTEKLREEKIPETDIYRVCLVTTLPEFSELLKKNDENPMLAIEFRSFVEAAVEKTGLIRIVALGIAEAVCSSLGLMIHELNGLTEMDRSEKDKFLVGMGKDMPAYVISPNLMQKDIDKVKSVQNGKNSADFMTYQQVIESYAQLGVPRAKYLLARTMSLKKEEDKGFRLMAEAAAEGDSSASVFLGNFYYEKGKKYWDKAYTHYTGYARASLNPNERKCLVDILNLAEWNKRLLLLDGLLVLITFGLLLLTSAFSLLSGAFWVGVVSLILEAATLGFGIFKYKTNPFTDLYFVTWVIFGVWLLAFMLRMGF